jgi:hypothetical protein
VKRAILIILLVALAGGGFLWIKRRSASQSAAAGERAAAEPSAAAKPEGEKPAGEKAAGDESADNKVIRDENGNSVLKMDDETQGNAGIKVAHPAAASLPPEIKGYGRVLDPAPLTALLTEMALARAAYPASSNELVRLKTLAGQGNASARALQSAEAAALHDELTLRSASDRLALSWGQTLAGQPDPSSFIQSLTSLKTVLTRIDLAPGETLAAPPSGARLSTLSGTVIEAGFLGPAPDIDPQTQGRGYFFLVKDNASGLLPGQALMGYLKLPGEPLAGLLVPREAVVRAEGAACIYLLNPGGESFTRLHIELDHPTDSGWVVSKGLKPSDYIVVTGAQTLLSEELKSMLSAD